MKRFKWFQKNLSLCAITLRIGGIVALILQPKLSGTDLPLIIGPVLIALSFVPERHIGNVREASNTRQFAFYAVLLTMGIIFILINISWLRLIGLAVVLLASYYSKQWPAGPRIIWPLLICLGGSVFELGQDAVEGHVFARGPLRFEFFLLIMMAWFVGISFEFFRTFPNKRQLDSHNSMDL